MDHISFVAVVCIATVALIAFFIFIARKQARARKERIRAAYQEILDEHKLTTSLMDEFPHRIIGMDTVKNVFVAMELEGEKTPATMVPLADVTACSVRHSGNSTTREMTSSIALLFQLRSGSTVEVPVFSEITDGINARPELARAAEKWQQLVKVTLRPGR